MSKIISALAIATLLSLPASAAVPRILVTTASASCPTFEVTSLRGKLFEGFVYFVDFLGTGVHVFHQFDLSLRASRAFVSNWVIAPMPGSLRIRWHKQGGEANDARSGPPLIGR